MTENINLDLFSLSGEPLDASQINEEDYSEYQAVAEWETAIQSLAVRTYYYNNVPVSRPFQLLNDRNNNPIWVIKAIYTFSDVAWRYKRNGEVVTDFCGRRGLVRSSFTCPRANTFQLVPAMREKGGTNVCFENNGCYNPTLIQHQVGGRLMVIPNDKRGTYGDNSGSFDVKVTVIEPLPL